MSPIGGEVCFEIAVFLAVFVSFQKLPSVMQGGTDGKERIVRQCRRIKAYACHLAELWERLNVRHRPHSIVAFEKGLRLGVGEALVRE